MEGPAPTALY